MIKRTLSAIALSGLLLAGCGGGTTEVARTEAPESPTATTAEATASAEPVESTMSTPSQAATTAPEPPAAPSETPPPTTTSPPADATPTPTDASTSAPADGSWVAMDVTVQTGAEAEQLTETSPDFRAYVAEEVDAPDSSGCDFEFIVTAFHPDGFAAGSLFSPDCGGIQNIWGKVSGNWRAVMSIQSIEDCSEMAKLGIPKGIPDFPCLDENGDLVDW